MRKPFVFSVLLILLPLLTIKLQADISQEHTYTYKGGPFSITFCRSIYEGFCNNIGPDFSLVFEFSLPGPIPANFEGSQKIYEDAFSSSSLYILGTDAHGIPDQWQATGHWVTAFPSLFPNGYTSSAAGDWEYHCTGGCVDSYWEESAPAGTWTVSLTPEPCTILLLSSGLIGLIGVHRQR